MSKEKLFVGLDVGKDEVVASIRGRKPKAFSHSTDGVNALVKWVRMICGESSLHICMEATGVYSRSVAVHLLSHEGVEISIVNPAQIKSFSRSQLRRTKTDNVDAEVIRQFAQSQNPRSWQPRPKIEGQLYQLVCQRDHVLQALLELENRNHSLSYDPDLPEEVKRSQRTLRRCYKRQIATLEESITRLCAEDASLSHQIALLTTIPGVAQNTAVHLVAFAGEKLRNFSAKELTAHAGLAPSLRQSGTSLNSRGGIAKLGDCRLRKILYMPAVCGMTHNPKLRTFYRRLTDAGKPNKIALVACMRKLLVIAQAIAKSKIPFNPKQ